MVVFNAARCVHEHGDGPEDAADVEDVPDVPLVPVHDGGVDGDPPAAEELKGEEKGIAVRKDSD